MFQNGHKEETDNIRIVLIVFGVITTVLAIAFLVNCSRKIMRDHKIIRVGYNPLNKVGGQGNFSFISA